MPNNFQELSYLLAFQINFKIDISLVVEMCV